MCPSLFWWFCGDCSCVCAWRSACHVCILPGLETEGPQVKGGCEGTWYYSSGQKGCQHSVNTPKCCRPNPSLGGQGHQAVDWCEDAFEGTDGGGSAASRAGFSGPLTTSLPRQKAVISITCPEGGLPGQHQSTKHCGSRTLGRQPSPNQNVLALRRQCMRGSPCGKAT